MGEGHGQPGSGKNGSRAQWRSADRLVDLQRTEYCADYASQHDLVRILAGVVIADGPVLSVISILRAEKAKAFGTREQQRLAVLMPHLKRVLEIRRKLEGLQLLQAASSHALEQLPTGVLLVDASGRLLFANAAAERVLTAGEGLTVEGGRLSAILARETVSLRALIGAAARTTNGQALNAGGVMAVSRPQHARPLSVLVTPVPGSASYGNHGRPAAAVLVSNPDQAQSPNPAVLRTLFGLTAAECRLVEAICSGVSLAEAAGSLKISRETAKSCLKQVFAKTGTSRQSELVTVVSRLAGAVTSTQP